MLGVGVLVMWPTLARAAPGEAEDADAAETAPRDERVRVAIGVGWMAAGLGASAGAGAGPIGALGGPMATATLEARLGGPAWAVAGVRGDMAQATANDQTSETYSVGGTAGLRLETPVFRWLDAGGHVLAEASRGAVEVSGDGGGEATFTRVGGVAGPSIHFRPSEVFGVRLALDVLHAGRTWAEDQNGEATAVNAGVSASPRAEVTFSF